jgi:dynein heavy chain, axonemal
MLQAEQDVMTDRDTVEALKEQVKTLQEECEVSVGEVQGPLEENSAALETLQLPDITALRGIKAPPKNLKLLMEAICLMKVGLEIHFGSLN